MALVRILVDGFSLLHAWTELAPGRPRHSPAAREQLVRVLTAYVDAVGTPLTLVFDGGRTAVGVPADPVPGQVEVLYTRSGQTADQVIERLTDLLLPFGEVLVVTDDHAEGDTVRSLGGWVSDCEGFVRTITNALEEFETRLSGYNRRERGRYRRR